MRVVFYIRTSLLDTALSLIQALSRDVELHVLLEIAPESWLTSAFEVERRDIPAGVLSGDTILNNLSPRLAPYWQGVADFKVVVHRTRSVHPTTWWTSYRAMRHIRRVQPDVVHFDDASLRLGWAIRELHSLPVVFSIHDPEPHTGENNWRTRLAYRLALREASRFILHNHALIEAFRARFGLPADCVDVVRLGALDLYRAWASEAPPVRQPVVLFFGRLSPYKGLETLYAAAPLVANEVPDARIIVAGQSISGYRPPKPPTAARLAVLPHYISNDVLADLFQQASVVVCPYIDATQSAVVMTAYAFDQPVVATDVGGLSEYVRDGQTGLIVPPRDPHALATALIRVLKDQGLRNRLAAGVRDARASEFNWSRAARETLEVYSRVIAAPALRSSQARTRLIT